MAAPEKVLVIGGGFTGLTAAYRLAQSGRVQVTLVERSPTLGGLAGDFALQGVPIEKSYHHLFRTDQHILDLVAELGLAETLLWCDSSLGIFLGGTSYPFMSPGDLLRFRPCDLFSRLRLGLVALYLQKRRNWQPLRTQTAAAWMRRACGNSAMRSVWSPLLRGKFDRYADQVSMAWLWARIHCRVNSRDTAGAERLGYFRGGFATVTRKLESELVRRGVAIRKGAAVTAIDASGPRPVVAVNAERQEFDRCIFTGPTPVLAQLVARTSAAADAYRRQLQAIEYLGAICLVFTSAQDLGDNYWLNVNEPDAPFLVCINHTKLISREVYHGRHVYYLGAYQPHDSRFFVMPEAELVNLWLGYLKTIHRHFDPMKIFERHLFRLKYAQHVVDTAYEGKVPALRTPWPGLYLASFAQIYPEDRGTNFAVREGNQVAALVLDDLAG
jgi:protoporphyrinogen oxidase